MRLNNYKILNPTVLNDFFATKNRNQDLISQANSQTYRHIDGYGEGWFLVSNDFTYSGETITLELTDSKLGTSEERTLYLLDIYYFDHPGTSSGRRIRLLHTAEYKYKYSRPQVARNYNVIEQRNTTSGQIKVLAPDSTPKTLTQIVEDISGATVTLIGNNLYVYNLFCQGMSVLDTIERLCRCYGLLWYAYNDGVDDQIVLFHASTMGTLSTPPNFNDVNNQALTSLYSYTTVYPVFDCCVQQPDTYRYQETDLSTTGKSIDTAVPYFPVILDPDGVVLNNTGLSSIHNGIRSNFNKIGIVENNYFVRDFIDIAPQDELTTPRSFYVTYELTGSGPRTTYFSDRYPILSPEVGIPRDRQARNWLGYLVYEYKGEVAGFFVMPVYGLDGYIDTVTSRYVVNIYGWDYGPVGGLVRVEWDCINARWIPIQQAYNCPPSYTPDPLPSPPAPESLITMTGMVP